MKNLKRLICLISSVAILLTIFPQIAFANTVDKLTCGVPGLNVWVERNNEKKGPDAKFILDSTQKYSGNYSAKLEYYGAPADNMQFRISKMAPATIGKTYRCGFMAKAERAEDVKIVINSVGSWMNLTKTYGTTFDWKLIEFEFVFTRENFNEMEFIIASWAKCGGFWVDDLYVYEVEDGQTVGENLFVNPGFEDIGTEAPYGEEVVEVNAYQDHDKIIPMKDSDVVLMTEAKDISVDGKPEDWAAYKSYKVEEWVAMDGREEEPATLDADIKYTYDDDNFYFIVSTEDNVHVADESGKYWNGDSIQLAIDNNNANGYGQPFGVIFSDSGKTRLYDGTSLAEIDIEKTDGIETACSRIGTKDYYEFKISWEYLGMEKPDEFKFCVMINDNDGDGRKGWRQLAPGISSDRTNKKYPVLYIERNNFTYELTSENEDVDINKNYKYRLFVQNITDREVALNMSGDFEKSVKIPSGESYVYYIDKAFDEYGENSVKVDIKDISSGKSYVAKCDITVIPTEETYKGLIEEVNTWKTELLSLVDKCEKAKIDIPYEYARYKIVECFAQYMQDEYDNYKAFYRIGNYYVTLKGVYEELKPQLESIINGEAKPLDVPEYAAGAYYDYNSKHFYGSVLRDGILTKEPILLTGYQNFLVEDDYDEKALVMGANSISIGYYISDFVKVQNGEYVIRDKNEIPIWRTTPPAIELEERLAKYDKMGVSVYVNFYESFDATLPGMKEEGKDYYLFMLFNPTHEQIYRQIELATEAVMPMINKHQCVSSLMVFNEPSIYAYDKEFYQEDWKAFLMERYNDDINELNKAYGSTYTDFEEVKMSPNATNDARFNDYRNFNDSILEGFYAKCRQEIRKYNKDIPIWTKEMMPIRNYGGAKTAGVNIEVLADQFDLNGNDSFAFWDNGQYPLAAKMEWYDIQTSVIDAPVINGENHIISDDSNKKINYNKKYDFHYAADVWEGMIHGAGLQEYWLFSRTDRALNSYGQTSLLFRPSTLDKVVKTTLDIHRLTPQIIALQDAPRETAILYSDSSWSFSGQFMNAMYQAYTNLLYLGQRPGFVFESQLEKADNYKMIVVPACTNVSAETLNKLDSFVQNGGKLVIIGDGSLYYDIKGEKHNEEVLNRVYANSTVINAKIDTAKSMIDIDGGFKDTLNSILKELNLMSVELIDADTGKKCSDVEYLYTNHDGKLVINLCNYSWDSKKNVEIFVNGKKVEKLNELRANKEISGDLTLESFEPVLVEINQ